MYRRQILGTLNYFRSVQRSLVLNDSCSTCSFEDLPGLGHVAIVIDKDGKRIMYEEALADLERLEAELLKIGDHFITRYGDRGDNQDKGVIDQAPSSP